MRTSVSLYHRHRFPAEIVSHCVWLYFRFALSFRDIEKMLAMRGVILTYDTVREWCLKFGQTYAKKAAKKFLRKLLKGLRYVPRVIITDMLKSYNAAKTEVLPSVEHCHQKYQNNRAENSHQPTRLRERVMRRYKSSGHAQRFLSVFAIIASHFRVGRHRYRARNYREVMKSRSGLWDTAICI